MSDFGEAAYAVASPPRVIKRYANRKFYDTGVSRYVNLEDIAEMIKGGIEVKILENGSMRDLTFVTLGHVISAEAKRRSKLCASTLRDLIRHGGARAEGADRIGEEAHSRFHACEHRLDALLSRGQRESHSVGQMVAMADSSLERLQQRLDERVDLAGEVVAGFGKVKRELVRLSRRVDRLHERLKELDRAS